MKKTLLVDGNNLMKIGFHGVKDYFHNGEHIGALYHFINTLRKFINEQNFDKVVVCWDGEDSTSLRGILYPKYKQNRKLVMEDAIFMSYLRQKNRIKQYLEEIYVRQIEISGREADDLIAYYCQVSENEDKLITVLAVTKNYGEIFPYISVGLLCLGLAIHLFSRYYKNP